MLYSTSQGSLYLVLLSFWVGIQSPKQHMGLFCILPPPHRKFLHRFSTWSTTACGNMNTCAQKLKIPNKTVFTSTNLPTYEICLAAQVMILAVIFSTSVLHSSLESLLVVIGSPRYVNGGCPLMNPINSRQSSFSFVLLPPNIILGFGHIFFEPYALSEYLECIHLDFQRS